MTELYPRNRLAGETAGTCAAADGAQAAEFLAGAIRRLAGSLDLRETLQEVAQAVVDHIGFGAAVVNLELPGNLCEVVAVAGPVDLSEALLGTRASMETWHQLLAACEAWGELRFFDHRNDQRTIAAIANWTPAADAPDAPDAWHPEDILLAPLHSASGALVGVLSVDLPYGGRRPGPARCQLLEQFAAYAALAIENSRVHTLVADSEQLFRAMFDRSPIAIALLAPDNVMTRVNAACEQLVGRSAAELVGRRADELTRPPDGRRRTDAVAGTGDPYEVHFTRQDGVEVWGRVHCTSLTSDSGGEELVLAQIEDTTLLRQAQARLAYDATHDKLTGLANRALIMERLAAALDQPAQDGGRVAVLFCDVDHFKEVNDTLGHAAGDRLLAGIARGLRAAARAGDTVGRLGGDEFVVVARPVGCRDDAEGLAERITEQLGQPGGPGGGPALSIGIALSVPGDTADTLLAAADRALYEAKTAGRGQWKLADGRELRPGPGFLAARVITGGPGRRSARPTAAASRAPAGCPVRPW
jgi:diguanylate cyclase (GGDEF)-like protein/PAS domain S-box-containing protein